MNGFIIHNLNNYIYCKYMYIFENVVTHLFIDAN